MTVHSPRSNVGNSGDKRERILDAAELIFAQRGFFSARVAEIAREAGVADGTIYLYFKSKDDLLISLFESRMERVNNTLRDAIAAGTTPTEKLELFLRTQLQMVVDNPNVAEVLTVELRQSSKFMKEYANPRFGDFLRLLGEIVSEGQACGEFNPDVPPAIVARMIFGAVDELALAWLLGGGEKFDIVRAADWVGAIVMTGLALRSDTRSERPAKE